VQHAKDKQKHHVDEARKKPGGKWEKKGAELPGAGEKKDALRRKQDGTTVTGPSETFHRTPPKRSLFSQRWKKDDMSKKGKQHQQEGKGRRSRGTDSQFTAT